MRNLEFSSIPRRLNGYGLAVAFALVALILTACGTTAETGPTAAATQAAATSEEATTAAEASAPQAMLAPAFQLPNAAGETVSLASYAGDKNVVLVFYRGFW